MPMTTDLTIYEVNEVLDVNRRGTGVYKLVRRSLEPDVPRETLCEHNHRTPQEAQICQYFEQEEKQARVKPKQEDAQKQEERQQKEKRDQLDLLESAKAARKAKTSVAA